jgi:hypothetical protein
MPGSAHEIATKSIIKHIGLIAQFTNCFFCISNAKKPAVFAGFSQIDPKLCSLAPAVLPIYSLASIENASVQIAPVPVQPLGSDACMKACMVGMPAVLAQLVVAPGPTQPTQQ